MESSQRQRRTSQSSGLFRLTQNERQKVDVACAEVWLGKNVVCGGLTKQTGLRIELSLSCYYFGSETSRVQFPQTANTAWLR